MPLRGGGDKDKRRTDELSLAAKGAETRAVKKTGGRTDSDSKQQVVDSDKRRGRTAVARTSQPWLRAHPAQHPRVNHTAPSMQIDCTPRAITGQKSSQRANQRGNTARKGGMPGRDGCEPDDVVLPTKRRVAAWCSCIPAISGRRKHSARHSATFGLRASVAASELHAGNLTTIVSPGRHREPSLSLARRGASLPVSAAPSSRIGSRPATVDHPSMSPKPNSR